MDSNALKKSAKYPRCQEREDGGSSPPAVFAAALERFGKPNGKPPIPATRDCPFWGKLGWYREAELSPLLQGGGIFFYDYSHTAFTPKA